MSKGSRKREAAVARREQEALRLQQEKKQRRRNFWISLAAVVACVVVVGGVVFAAVQAQRAKDPNVMMHKNMVATSENYEISQSMMSYLIQVTASQYAANNKDFLDMLKLDTSKSLKEQICYFDSTITWFDYFADNAMKTAKWMLAFAEQAVADGKTLTDADKAEIDETIGKLDMDTFGEYINEQDVRKTLELHYLANKQETAVQEGMTATDEQVNAYYEAYKQQFIEVDYTYYYITYGTASKYTKETAKAFADKLMTCNAEQFEKAVKDEMVAQGLYTTDTVGSAYQAYVRNGYKYSEDDGISDWLFKEAKVGDHKMVESASSYTVYLCLAEPARNTERQVDVRHILFTKDTYKTDEAAEQKAKEVWDEWKKGEATEASFGALATKYTEDSNGEAGGLYTGVTEGKMVETFNDWCFDEARKTGDTDIVKTEYGYHLMYFVDSGEAWYNDVRDAYLDHLYQTIRDGYVKTYEVTLDKNLASTINF